MIARAYGADLMPAGEGFAGELGHGWFNVAYCVTLRDGRQVVLGIAPPRQVAVMTYEHEMMRKELAALDFVQNRTCVPVPPVDHTDTSGELIAADWFFVSCVDADKLGILLEGEPDRRLCGGGL